jgi:hypothetical protein
MNERRQAAVNNLIQILHERREDLLSGIRGCGFECSSIMYGALSKEMHSNDLLSPRPAAPFPNLNYKYLVWKVLSFASPQWRGPYSGYASYGSNYPHNCYDSSFTSLFGKLNDAIEGLDLDDLES